MAIMLSTPWAAALLSVSCLAGCSSNDSTGSGGGGVASTTTASGQGGAGGASGGVCTKSAVPQLELTVEGVVQHTDPTKPTDVEIDGKVTQATAGSIVIDSCLPGNLCIPKLTTVSLAATGLPEKPVPVDAFVHVRYHAETAASGAMAQHLVVQNLATFGTEPNLVRSSQRVWLTIDTIDGGVVPMPVGLDPLPLGETASACSGLPSAHALTLTPPGGKPLVVDVGASGTIDFAGGLEGHYTVRNLVDDEDASGNHRGYWVVGT